MQIIPKEVFIDRIFPFLSEIELGRCCRVSTLWNTMASCDTAWRSLAANISYPQVPTEEGMRNFC